MKSMKFLIMMLFAGSLFMVSCDDEEVKGTCSDGIQNQDETGVDCGGACTACREGVQGKWHSFPVATILSALADSINAEFKTNNTYTVDQWKGGAKIVLTGTYSQTKRLFPYHRAKNTSPGWASEKSIYKAKRRPG